MVGKYIAGILREGRMDDGTFLNKNELCRFVKLSRNNEILFLALSLIPHQSEYNGFISELRNKEEKLSKDIAQSIVEITDIFDKKGLKFFTMKSIRSYPYTDDDVDIVIVDRERVPEYAKALIEIGYDFKWNRSVLREPGKWFYVKKDGQGKYSLPKMHLHSCVSWNGIEFFDPASIWKRLRVEHVMNREIRIPSIEDELLIMSAHAFHENSYITIGELLHLRNLLSEAKAIDTEYMIDASKKYNWTLAMRYYFLYADLYYKSLTGEYILTDAFKHKLNIPNTARAVVTRETFPFLLPVSQLLNAYSNKIIKDFCSLKFYEIPREVLSFGIVTWLSRIKNNTRFTKEI